MYLSTMALTLAGSAVRPRFPMKPSIKGIYSALKMHLDASAYNLFVRMHSSTARKWSM